MARAIGKVVKRARAPAMLDRKLPAQLYAKAREAAANAYAPYSGFAVGAAVETSDGRIFAGANMENASYGLTACAEIGALQAATSAGALGDIRRMVIVGGLKAGATGRPQVTAPCGRCRQLIAEAAFVGGRDIEVWFADLDGRAVQHRMISELLPDAFGPNDLGKDKPKPVRSLRSLPKAR
jgi:cytidine deaminase